MVAQSLMASYEAKRGHVASAMVCTGSEANELELGAGDGEVAPSLTKGLSAGFGVRHS